MSINKKMLEALSNAISSQLSDRERYELKKASLIRGLASTFGQIKSVEEIKDLCHRLEKLSLSELKQLLSDVADMVPVDGCRDYYNFIESEQVKSDFDYTNKSMFYTDMVWSLNEEMRESVVSSLANQYPTDRVCTTTEVIDLLQMVWQKDDDDSSYIHVPTDLLVSGQICLTDMEIEIDKSLSDDVVCKYHMRIQVEPNYQEYIADLNDDDIAWIGLLDVSLPQSEGKGVVCRFGVMRGVNSIILDTSAFSYGMSHEDIVEFNRVATEGKFVVLMSRFLQTWYTIQLAMLNPMLKVLFCKGRRTKDKRKRLAGKKLSNLSRPLNLHTVYMENIVEACGGKDYNRKTMVWYVMGHWRKYQNGKVGFVSPYWKGPLRNVKGQTVVRERVIDTSGLEV